MSQVARETDPDAGRLPYSLEDLKKIFSRDACDARKARVADHWLPLLAWNRGMGNG